MPRTSAASTTKKVCALVVPSKPMPRIRRTADPAPSAAITYFARISRLVE